MMMFLVFNSAIVSAQEREMVTFEQLLEIYDLTYEMTNDIAEKRKSMESDETAKSFFQSVVEYQKNFEPVIILIAETDPPREAQLYAISVAIAVKEAELALWLYIKASVSNQQKYLNFGDVLLGESKDELESALLLNE